MYKVSILTIGDEVCIGQTVNTNATWIATQLDSVGACILTHSTIRDNHAVIISEIERLSSISDLLIITGGLGSTHDDITKITLCDFYQDTLVLNQQVDETIKQLFIKRGKKELAQLERNKQQAMLPSKCIVLDNKIGTAPGMLFKQKQFTLIALPGVPQEMKSIIDHSVTPYVIKQIDNRHESVLLHKTLRTIGIGESSLAELIGETDFLKQSSLAFLPSYSGVKLRIDVTADNLAAGKKELARIQDIISERVKDYIVSFNDDGLIQLLSQKLIDDKCTLSIAESCTGGLLGSRLTSIAGSSSYFKGGVVSYSSQLKQQLLGVNDETLTQYGAVSKQTAIEMVLGAKKRFNTDCAISITGIAGPDGGSKEKPVGLVWIGIATSKTHFAKRFLFGRDRKANRELAVYNSLYLLLNAI